MAAASAEKQSDGELLKEAGKSADGDAAAVTPAEKKVVLEALTFEPFDAKAPETFEETQAVQEAASGAGTPAASALLAVPNAEQLVAASAPATPSAAEAEAMPVEAFNWQQLQMSSKNYCANCKKPVEAHDKVRVCLQSSCA